MTIKYCDLVVSSDVWKGIYTLLYYIILYYIVINIILYYYIILLDFELIFTFYGTGNVATIHKYYLKFNVLNCVFIK
jgi:hypothetical protein